MKYTISDIANMCGVSKATVSRVLNNKDTGFSETTRKIVLDKIQELGYRPSTLSKNILSTDTKIIGMIVPDLKNLIQTDLVRGVEDYLSPLGYNLIIAQTGSDPQKEQELLTSLVQKGVDGIILCSGISNKQFLEYYKKYNMPISLIGRTFDKHVSDASITGDNETGAIQAMEHFIQNGNKNIALIDCTINNSSAQQRLTGYKTALKRHNIAFNMDLVLHKSYSVADGHDMVCSLIEKGQHFSAVLAGGDLLAIGALSALKQYGLNVPDDVEIIGFDDIEIASIYDPKISSVKKPHYSMASMAAKMLIEKINGELGDICHLSVKPDLILRETTKNK